MDNTTPEITDVYSDTKKIIAQHAVRNTFLMAGSLAVAVILFMALSYAGGITTGLVLAAIFPLMVGGLIYASAYNKATDEFLQQLGARLGLTYAPTASMDTVQGAIFSVGHSKNIVNVLSGAYKEYPIRLYTYTYVTGEGKSSRLNKQHIFELTYPKQLPRLLFNESAYSHSDLEPVELEGDFNKKSSLYVEKGKQMEARELFQPDMMAELLDEVTAAKDFGFETNSNKVYIQKTYVPLTEEGVESFQSFADKLVDRMLPGLAEIAESNTA